MQGFGERFGEGNIRDICAEATHAGINFYDTAEVYGYQNNDKKESSEYIVGRSAAPAGAPDAALNANPEQCGIVIRNCCGPTYTN